MGNSFPETEEKKMELIFKLVREFKDKYTQGIDGKYIHPTNVGGSKVKKHSGKETMIYQLNQLFSGLFEKFSKKDFKITDSYTND